MPLEQEGGSDRRCHARRFAFPEFVYICRRNGPIERHIVTSA